MNVLRAGIVLVLFGACVTGCQNKLAEENRQFREQNLELQAKLSESEAQRRQMADPSTVTQMQQEIALRDQKIAELQASLTKPAPGQPADPGIEGIETTYDKSTGEMTVNIPGDVLFDSGTNTLKATAKKTLDTIVNAIKKDYAGKHVFVDGYTDSDPINKTKDKWEDNLDLSAGRARAVAKYLTDQGLATKLVDPRAMGATNPKKNKAASRRVEIVVSTR